MTSTATGAAAAVLGPLARFDVPFGTRTTYRVGGTAALGVVVAGVDDLTIVARALSVSGIEAVVLGRGSNTLVADGGFDGLLIELGEWATDVVIDATSVRAGGATSLPVLARQSVAASLHGLEWMVGVPGTVGGAVRMNAGGHGSDMAMCLSRVRVFDLASGEDTEMAPAALHLQFRHSALRDGQVVISADFDLEPGSRAAGEAELAEIVRWRREHQPGGQNAGSVFVNPLPRTCGELIDAAGLRGARLGTAEVSTKHANFIQADPGGSADDVFHLMQHVRDRVEAVHGVRLRSEIRLVGFGADRFDLAGAAL